ncbi:hypothetical protein [Catenuloplanes atrovinosus]|uniref:Uncharacterized protein n=1 Tax=Catenuloplanes atrovinosus TaxID=137266 RepID=A0AAE4CC59_9ACTN|nr:hypothetical protein [Catenuloplanes atrovinosus]MDR7276225.1 hypothetical protein [Catenuloplanes atrovinosus]
MAMTGEAGDRPIRALAEALRIPGARRVALVAEGASAPTWTSTPGGPEEPTDGTATVAVVMVQAARELLRLTAGGDVDDLLLTSGEFFHVLRLVERPGRGAEVVHLTLRRSGANLAMARHEFRRAAAVYRDGPPAIGATPVHPVPPAAEVISPFEDAVPPPAPAGTESGAGFAAGHREPDAASPGDVPDGVGFPAGEPPPYVPRPYVPPPDGAVEIAPDMAWPGEMMPTSDPIGALSGATLDSADTLLPRRTARESPEPDPGPEPPVRLADGETPSLLSLLNRPFTDDSPTLGRIMAALRNL